jgi:cytochrome P450
MAEPELIDRAVEEILRYVSPAAASATVTQTTNCAAQLKQGDRHALPVRQP